MRAVATIASINEDGRSSRRFFIQGINGTAFRRVWGVRGAWPRSRVGGCARTRGSTRWTGLARPCGRPHSEERERRPAASDIPAAEDAVVLVGAPFAGDRTPCKAPGLLRPEESRHGIRGDGHRSKLTATSDVYISMRVAVRDVQAAARRGSGVPDRTGGRSGGANRMRAGTGAPGSLPSAPAEQRYALFLAYCVTRWPPVAFRNTREIAEHASHVRTMNQILDGRHRGRATAADAAFEVQVVMARASHPHSRHERS